jgi:hypothetical protein
VKRWVRPFIGQKNLIECPESQFNSILIIILIPWPTSCAVATRFRLKAAESIIKLATYPTFNKEVQTHFGKLVWISQVRDENWGFLATLYALHCQASLIYSSPIPSLSIVLFVGYMLARPIRVLQETGQVLANTAAGSSALQCAHVLSCARSSQRN